MHAEAFIFFARSAVKALLGCTAGQRIEYGTTIRLSILKMANNFTELWANANACSKGPKETQRCPLCELNEFWHYDRKKMNFSVFFGHM